MTSLGRVGFAPVLLALALGFSGCATYQYTQQNDSAYVRGIDNLSLWPMFNRGPTLSVLLASIDGQFVGMLESGNSGRYLSPGHHTLGILCTDSTVCTDSDVIYPIAETVEVEAQAKHTYQFTIDVGLQVTLWDDTAGEAKRAVVTAWDFYAEEYEDSEPIAVADVAGANYVRPPFVSGDKRGGKPGSGHGGPPSIPTHPRSGGGGGSRGGGGGHSGGGGGGGGHKK